MGLKQICYLVKDFLGEFLTGNFTSPNKIQRKSEVFCSLGCGANFTATSGRVVSPNYPADYPDHSNCNYTIDAGAQTVVIVTFQIFQIEGKS